MLYDPKWEKTKAAPLSLVGLIAWLEIQPPNEAYEWARCDGTCLIDQYLKFIGMPNDRITNNASNYFQVQGGRPSDIAIGYPRTFGAALKRARAVLELI